MKNSLLAASIMQALNRVTPDHAIAKETLVQNVARANLREVKIIPVPPGHAREPKPTCFDIDRAAGVCYVRAADWPKLKRVLMQRRKDGGDDMTIEVTG